MGTAGLCPTLIEKSSQRARSAASEVHNLRALAEIVSDVLFAERRIGKPGEGLAVSLQPSSTTLGVVEGRRLIPIGDYQIVTAREHALGAKPTIPIRAYARIFAFALGAIKPDDGRISRAMRDAVLARDGHRCVSCGATSELQMDHVHAWSLGGTTTFRNLQTLCKPCNCRKGQRYVDLRDQRATGRRLAMRSVAAAP